MIRSALVVAFTVSSSCAVGGVNGLTPHALDFGAGFGPNSPARALYLNNAGDVAASLSSSNHRVHWADGGVSIIGTPVVPGYTVSSAERSVRGISDRGEVLVWGNAFLTGTSSTVFLPQRFTRDAGVESVGFFDYFLYVNGAIGRDGTIAFGAGVEGAPLGSRVTSVTTGGAASDLAFFDNAATVAAFGRAGEVIGTAIQGSDRRAFRVDSVGNTQVAQGQRHTVGGANAHGVAVGHYVTESNGRVEQAFAWRPGDDTPERLETLSGFEASLARDINDQGFVVGQLLISAAAGEGSITNTRAALWTPTGEAIDMNSLLAPDSGWLLTSAWAINESNQVAGWGFFQGVHTPYLLTIPAPASALPLMPGVLLAMRRRR